MSKSAKLAVIFLTCGLIGFWISSLFRQKDSIHSEGKKPAAIADVAPKISRPASLPTKERIVDAVAVRDERGGVTTQSVEKMRRAAVKAIEAGRNEQALSELLICLNDTFVKGVHKGVRYMILLDLAKLAEVYPPAKGAMLDYRDAALELMISAPDPANLDYATTFAWINKAMRDENASVDVLDRLPSADPRRRILGTNAFDTLIDRKRYADAAESKGLANMLQEIEQQASYPKDKTTDTYKFSIVNDAAKHIEALAGASKLDEAQVLINRVLAYDGSDRTKRIIKDRLMKSGVSLDVFSGL